MASCKVFTRIKGIKYRVFFLKDNTTLFIDANDNERFCTVSNKLNLSKIKSLLFFNGGLK